jgi:4-amino-4-deoxy-L-arabinose transferase-like glycosyltransferase
MHAAASAALDAPCGSIGKIIMKTMKITKEFWLLAGIMAVAIFTRTYNLAAVPPGLWPDEALNGVQAIQEPLKIFYPENQGREGLIMALDKLSFDALGVSMFAFRLVPAIIGILTVLGVYLLALELFKPAFAKAMAGKEKTLALLAAFFVATSFWHINFSRINFRAIMLPMVLVYSFYFLFLGMRKKSWWPFVASGLVFGTGFYTYTSFRLAPVILFTVLFFWWLASKKENGQKKFFGHSLLMLLATFFTALPIGLYFLMGHMQDFFGRVGGISVFSQPNPLLAFLESLGLHLAMFNIYGDPNMRHNYSGDPQLFWPVGILFLVGFFLMLKRGIFNFKQKNWKEFLPYITLFIWFFVMLLPGALTYEGMPHALRVIGVIPAAYILAALGGVYLYGKLKIAIKNKAVLASIVVIFLVFSGIMPVCRYFCQWARNPETANAFSKDLVAMGNFLKTSPDTYEKYVIMYGGDLPVQTVKLIALENKNNKSIKYLWASDIDSINPLGPAFVLFMENNAADLQKLENKYPNADLKPWIPEAPSKLWVYFINQP